MLEVNIMLGMNLDQIICQKNPIEIRTQRYRIVTLTMTIISSLTMEVIARVAQQQGLGFSTFVSLMKLQ